MDVFVARQPIFNMNQKVCGYELLYRVGTQNYYDFPDGDQATSEVVANTFLLLGLETLTGGKRAYINFTQNLLKNGVASLLPKDYVAIEILEDVEIDNDVMTACKDLKRQGYMLVLDDFVFDARYTPLIEMADTIKIDFLNTTEGDRASIAQWNRTQKAKLLAEKVETRESFEEAVKLGFEYFQGYFFSKPVILAGKDVPAYKLNYLHVLNEVNKPEIDFDQMESAIKRDFSLSYKLLKYINSAAYGFKTKINSIKQALVLLGAEEVKKWVSLVALRKMAEDKPDEIMTSSVIRARFGELLAPLIGLQEYSSDLFLMGMFSMIDALIDRPLEEILSELPISDDIKDALLGRNGRFKNVYDLILAYEKGDWTNFSKCACLLDIDEVQIPQLFLDALLWANQFFCI